jgi:thiamine biosynthesis lipoprotein
VKVHRGNRVEHVMGTAISVDVRDDVSSAATDDVFAWFRLVDDTFSTYRPESPISRLGRGDIAMADCPSDVTWVLDRCAELRRETDGAFDVWATGTLDPSGYVKGWAVDVASAMLAARGSENHCINAGGDVRLRGVPEGGRLWQTGIAHPLVPHRLTTVIAATDAGIATSGTSERGEHIIDPRTKRGCGQLASVTVVGPDLTSADVYATTAIALGLDAPRWLETLEGHESYVIDAVGNAWWTSGFPDLLSPELGGLSSRRWV